MSKYISEILSEANKDPRTILAHKDNRYLRNVMNAAYLKQFKMILPEGNPPYKENTLKDSQVSGTFWQVAKKIDVFYRAELKSIFREKAFIGALESMSTDDAKIFIHIKDQTLPSIFPNLTLPVLIEIGYFGDEAKAS
jgi:hypothetical protein